jgi:hypothetical protein
MPGDIAIRHLACLFHSAPSVTGRVLQPIEPSLGHVISRPAEFLDHSSSLLTVSTLIVFKLTYRDTISSIVPVCIYCTFLPCRYPAPRFSLIRISCLPWRLFRDSRGT